jgi:ornithine cyclodeaminase/alanine dehydrogenase-like protein (mu-crystallin family)
MPLVRIRYSNYGMDYIFSLGSLLSTTLIGPSTPKKLVTFGAGKQIEAHLDLFIRHFPSISHCTIVNRTINVRSNFLKETIQARFSHINLHVIPLQENQEMEDAVRSADVIICATSSTVPLFPSSWVRTGTHVILIGSFTPAMREVERELVLRAVQSPTCLLVDYRKACLEEAGELIDAGLDAHQLTEIGELVRRCRPDEEIDGGITMFKSVGVGLQDVAIACAVVAHALSRSDGTVIERYDCLT